MVPYFIDNEGYQLVHIGRYTFDLAFENVIKVAVVSHPSLLKVPEDLEVCSVYVSSISLFTLCCYHSVAIVLSLLLFCSSILP